MPTSSGSHLRSPPGTVTVTGDGIELAGREPQTQANIYNLTGLDYNLLTKFTSFIAVQDVVRTTQGSTDVTQPIAMPAGVTDSAISQSESMEVGAEPPFAWLMRSMK